MMFIAAFLLQVWSPTHALHASSNDPGQLLADWIRVHRQLVRTTKGVGHVAYSRHFAYTAVAVYEAAIPGETQQRSLVGQLQDLDRIPVYNGKNKFIRAAGVNAAYAEMMKAFYGANSNAFLIDSMERVSRAEISKNGNREEAITASEDFGKAIAKSILAWAASDGAMKKYDPYVVPAGVGLWIPTPPQFGPPAVPYWKFNRMMVPATTIQVKQAGPPAFSTREDSEFYKMVKEVYAVSQNLTEEQEAIAWFWDDSPNGRFVTVMGHWSSILEQVIRQEELTLEKSIEAFVRMHIAIYDACIEAWRGKYTYHLLRPVSYIQEHIDKDWNSLIETPSHPEFPAAHATLSSSAATALTAVLGKVSFVDNTYSDLGMASRRFSSFDAAAEEAGLSRLYGGIHYRHSIYEGLQIGKRVAENTLKHIALTR